MSDLQTLIDHVSYLDSVIRNIAPNFKPWKIEFQSETLPGVHLAICISTEDPLNLGRVKFFTPLLSDKNSPIEGLPWAYPIQSFGGLDDSGSLWVPPAGSTVAIIFQNGNRDSPFYLGTTWNRKKMQGGYPLDEYDTIWKGNGEDIRESGYLAGSKGQLYPPWNSEAYNGVDHSQTETIDTTTDAFKKRTFPSIYGFKTPGKHQIKLADGNHKCNNRDARIEILSGRGAFIIIKDDHLHKCGEWANPSCTPQQGDLEECNFDKKEPKTECSDTESKKSKEPDKQGMNAGTNVHFKRKEECRPYKGANTPQNNACALPQSGLQIQSISGHQFIFDDSVEQPSGKPNFDLDFDFGCTDLFLGKTFWKSATGHSITLNDKESQSGIRDKDNGIKIQTAGGHLISLSDHTSGAQDSENCPPNLGGNERGIVIKSSALGSLEIMDEGNQQCSPKRKEGGQPQAKASNAFVRLRTGYGLEFGMFDTGGQESTKSQSIRILSPQKDNTKRGPHLLEFIEKAEGDGVVLMRAGGVYELFTYGNCIESIGDPENDEDCSKITIVKNNYIIQNKNLISLSEENAIISAKKIILLRAGTDCPNPDDGELGPCDAPVVVLNPKTGKLCLSDRVYAATSEKSQPVSPAMLLPSSSNNQ